MRCISCPNTTLYPLITQQDKCIHCNTHIGVQAFILPTLRGTKKNKNKKTYQPNVHTPIHFVCPDSFLNSHSSPCKWASSHPLPNRGEVIWTAEYKWLGMIDGPSHSPPLSRQIEIQADVRVPLAPSSHFSRSPGFCSRLPVSPTRPLNPLSPAVTRVKTF